MFQPKPTYMPKHTAMGVAKVKHSKAVERLRLATIKVELIDTLADIQRKYKHNPEVLVGVKNTVIALLRSPV